MKEVSFLYRKDVAIVLGLSTVLSSVYYLFVSVIPNLQFLFSSNPIEVYENAPSVPIYLIVILLALFGLYSFILLKQKDTPMLKKVVWVMAFFAASIIAFPLFWYFYIWKEN